MAATYQIIILNSVTRSDGSFSATGVFWLTPPSNAIIPIPGFRSAFNLVSSSDLALLRAGTVVEQAFDGGFFAASTTLATIETYLQNLYTIFQNNLNNINPPLSGLVNAAYNGTSWASISTPVVASLLASSANQVYLDIPFGTALGLIPGVTASRATGYVATSAVTSKAIRATTYAPQGNNAQRSIVSTSINDASAGTGARTVVINYLNTSFVLKQETVTLNGLVAVNTVNTDIAFIESMQVTTVGTQGGGNVGTINLMTGITGLGTVWASIAASDNTTFYAHHYVPAGVTCYLLNISGGGTVVGGAVTINRSGNPLTVNLPQVNVGGTYPHLAAGNVDHTFVVPFVIPGPDLIWLVERPDAVTGSTSYGTFEFLQF